MPNCQYCNKPVISGNICQECAQKNQNNQQRPAGGFSLNSLLRNSFPTPASRQQQTPVQPTQQTYPQNGNNFQQQAPSQQPAFAQPAGMNNQQYQNQQQNQSQPGAQVFSQQSPMQATNHYAPDPSVSAAALDKIVGPSNSSKINNESEEGLLRLFSSIYQALYTYHPLILYLSSAIISL